MPSNLNLIVTYSLLYFIVLQPSFAYEPRYYESIISESRFTVDIDFNTIKWKCKGDYENRYESDGWEEKVTFTSDHVDLQGVNFYGNFGSGKGKCIHAMEKLREESIHSGGKIIRQLTIIRTKTRFNTWVRYANHCSTYFQDIFEIDFFKDIYFVKDQNYGRVHLKNRNTEILGACDDLDPITLNNKRKVIIEPLPRCFSFFIARMACMQV